MEKEARREERPLRLLRGLRKEGVRHLVVGGFAAMVYGVERATFHIDIAFTPDSADIGRLLTMLSRMGYSEALDPDTWRKLADTASLTPGRVLERGCVRFRNRDSIDVMILHLDTFDFL